MKIILIFLLFLVLYKIKNTEKFSNFKHQLSEVCRGYLTDLEYLNHMIPHHQVAVDISKMLQKISTSPVMHDILRKLIWTQETEIIMMKIMRRKLPRNISSRAKMKRDYITTLSDFVKPNKVGLTSTYCDPHFFDPKEHMKHLKHMNHLVKMD